jgi:diguanylate cyclase (GGDEF)-like protein
MTLAIYVASVALGVLCICLFLLAVRRLMGRQEEIITTMLLRYDDRLAEFAQTLNDALAQPLPERIAAAITGAPTRELTDHGVLRLLEVARERTSADAAVAVIADPKAEPMLATVGLSQAEVAQVERLGIPDYRDARALQVSFNGDADTPPGTSPIRAGLAVPLLDAPHRPGMLAVLTRTSDRTFTDMDITTLEDVLSGTKAALESSLALREPDPVPELDALTELYDRRAFHDLLDREIGRARGRGQPLALLMLDVDRLTTLNARIGFLAADDVLVQIAAMLRDVAGRSDLPCRIGGGRFGVLLPRGDARDGEALFGRLQRILRERPLPKIGVMSMSGGVAELLQNDDAAALLGRADAALGLAKGSGRDTVITTARQ